MGILRDVTSSKGIEEELRRTKEKLDATLDALPDLMFEVDRQGRIYEYRAPTTDLLYVRPEEFTGSLVDEVIPADAARVIMDAVEEASRTGRHRGGVYSLDLPSGTHWFELSIQSRGAPDRPDGRLVALVRDITERMLFEQSLEKSEERFRTVADFTYDWETWQSPDGRNIYVSPSCERITGYGSEEFVKEPGLLLRITHPDDREAVKIHVEEALNSEAALQMDFRIVDRQGEEHWIGHACQRVTGVGGKNLGRRESNRDVTGQKNAERALADSESLFRTLAEASPDAVTVTDLEGRIVFTSQRTVSLHDYDAVDDIVGRPAFELFPPEELERAAENMMRTLREGTIRNVEYKLLKKDGRFFIGEMNASLIKDSDGNPKAFLATTRDITRRKEGEVKLQQLNVELEAFAHTASHDLRGPLSSIGMAATLLRDLFDRPLTVENVADIKELMGTVERNVNRSQSLVQGLLSDAEAGRDPSQTAEIDVAGVVVSAVQDAMQPIEQAGLEVRSDPYMGHIVANHTHIYQLFSNLISNAIKYNDREDPVLNIKYLGEGPDGEKRYLVSDNGPGFAPGMKDRIFQPFVSGRAGEPGMGLSIVRKVVETYGGTIVAYNDGGACFEFSLFDYKSG